MAEKIELHFQEGFNGEPIEVHLDGRLVASFDARTRMQSGFARVIHLDAEPGRDVTIAMPKAGATAAFRLQTGAPFVRINLEGGDLVIAHDKDRARYA